MTDGMIWLPVAALVVVVLIIAAARILGSTSRPAIPVVARRVLTASELVFYRRLIRALENIGGVDVMPQVSMSAVMDTRKGLDPQTARATRNRFDRKTIDFVVVDAETNVLLIIELDDWSHDGQGERDSKRDEITAAAGHRTLRIRGKAAKNDAEVERLVRQALRTS